MFVCVEVLMLEKSTSKLRNLETSKHSNLQNLTYQANLDQQINGESPDYGPEDAKKKHIEEYLFAWCSNRSHKQCSTWRR